MCSAVEEGVQPQQQQQTNDKCRPSSDDSPHTKMCEHLHPCDAAERPSNGGHAAHQLQPRRPAAMRYCALGVVIIVCLLVSCQALPCTTAHTASCPCAKPRTSICRESTLTHPPTSMMCSYGNSPTDAHTHHSSGYFPSLVMCTA